MIDDKNLKTIIEEVIGNNDLYLNTTVYDIVKKIIEDHGGKIWATSKEGIGTEIHFVLRKYQEVVQE